LHLAIQYMNGLSAGSTSSRLSPLAPTVEAIRAPRPDVPRMRAGDAMNRRHADLYDREDRTSVNDGQRQTHDARAMEKKST